MPRRTDLNHALQLRLPNNTVAEIDGVIATFPELCGFNRCRFIRAAVDYALAWLAEESPLAEQGGAVTQENDK
jgi:hypothetical protein